MRDKQTIREKLIVALDTPQLETVQKLLEELQGVVSFYKVGFECFLANGWKAADLVRRSGGRIFLDLKLHDIPNTASSASKVILEHGVEMFNVHALGGAAMMQRVRECVDAAGTGKNKRPMVLGVTILTSHRESDLKPQLGIDKSLKEEVLTLARQVKEAGLDGVVCSPEELSLLRKEFPKNFLLVTPGIRFGGKSLDDQKRTLSPGEAVALGADYLVVGRPITASPRPREAALEVIREMESGV